jgi:hypothetical protein
MVSELCLTWCAWLCQAGRSGRESDNKVDFTDAGWELMLISFNIQKELRPTSEWAEAGDVEELRRSWAQCSKRKIISGPLTKIESSSLRR